MEFKKLIKYFFVCGSAYFTAICSSFLVILAIITSENANFGVEPSKFLLLLAFCFVMSFGSTIRRTRGIPSRIGWICNAVCYVGGCFAFLLAFNFQFFTSFVITIAFACIYTPIAILIAFKNKKKRGASILSTSKKPATKASKSNTRPAKKSESNEKADTPYQNLFS